MIRRIAIGAVAYGACAASAFVPAPPLRRRYVDSSCAASFVADRNVRQSEHSSCEVRKGAVPLTMSEQPEQGGLQRSSRRKAIADVGKLVAGALVGSSLASTRPERAEALGPVKILLTEPEYHSVTCPPKTQVPGEKAGAGLKPVCVKVTVSATNPNKQEIVDAAVFGFVYDEDNTSVVANNPDGASDAGQFAIIDKVPVGNSRVSFQFVAAIEPQEDFDLKKLKFTSLKAISYPGGQRYGAITECEMNPLAEGCDFD